MNLKGPPQDRGEEKTHWAPIEREERGTNYGHNDGQGEAYRRATSTVENGGDVICNRPDVTLCLDCGENTPERGTICEECREDALGD